MLPVWHLRVINQVQGRMPSCRSTSLGVYFIERRSARLVQVLFNARPELSLFYLWKFILTCTNVFSVVVAVLSLHVGVANVPEGFSNHTF